MTVHGTMAANRYTSVSMARAEYCSRKCNSVAQRMANSFIATIVTPVPTTPKRNTSRGLASIDVPYCAAPAAVMTPSASCMAAKIMSTQAAGVCVLDNETRNALTAGDSAIRRPLQARERELCCKVAAHPVDADAGGR